MMAVFAVIALIVLGSAIAKSLGVWWLEWISPNQLGLTYAVLIGIMCAYAAIGIGAFYSLVKEYALYSGALLLLIISFFILGLLQGYATWLSANLFETITIAVALAGFAVTVWTLVVSSWINLRNQRISVRILCIERYDSFIKTWPEQKDIGKLDEEGLKNHKERLFKYYRQLWAIKKDQLDFWVMGYVEPEVILGWFNSDVAYLSGGKEGIEARDRMIENWNRAIGVPGSVDTRLTELIVNIGNIVSHFHCADCQRDGLFWLFMALEQQEKHTIRARNAHGIGRQTFESLLEGYPGERAAVVRKIGEHIQSKRTTVAQGAQILSSFQQHCPTGCTALRACGKPRAASAPSDHSTSQQLRAVGHEPPAQIA